MQLKAKKGFSLVIFFGFCTYTLMSTQIVPFLTHLGYSPTQRGYVLSMVSVIAILGQVVMGYISDRYKTMRSLFIYLSLVIVLTAILSYSIEINNFWYHFFIVGMGAGITKTTINFLESWIMEVDGMQSEFGAIRAYGSLGWSLFSLFSGFLITQWGYPSLAVITSIFTLVVIFFASKLPDATKVSKKVDLAEVKLLFKNKNFVLLIWIYLITFIAYNADSITVTDYMISLGATESLIGIKWFIQAVFEIPTMFIGYRILRRKGSPWMLMVGVFVLMFRLGASALSANNTIIILLGTLQIFSYPFILLSQKDLVYKEIPEHLRSTGQLVSISLSVGLGGALTPIISGYLNESMGIQNTLYIFALMMLIPLGFMRFLDTES